MRLSTLHRRTASWAAACALLASAGTAAAQEPQPAQPTDTQPAPPPPPAAPTQPGPPDAIVVPPPEHHHDVRHEYREHEKDQKKNFWEKWEWLEKFKVSGYLQPQMLWQWYDETASPNAGKNGLPAGIGPNSTIATANGLTTNGDYFRMRRDRLKTEFEPSEGSRFVFEIDPFAAGGSVPPTTGGTTGGGSLKGTGTIARQVEAQGIIHWPGGIGVSEFAAGMFKNPVRVGGAPERRRSPVHRAKLG